MLYILLCTGRLSSRYWGRQWKSTHKGMSLHERKGITNYSNNFHDFELYEFTSLVKLLRVWWFWVCWFSSWFFFLQSFPWIRHVEWKLGDTPATEPSGEPFLSGSEISGRSLVISRDADAQEEIQDWSFTKGYYSHIMPYINFICETIKMLGSRTVTLSSTFCSSLFKTTKNVLFRVFFLQGFKCICKLVEFYKKNKLPSCNLNLGIPFPKSLIPPTEAEADCSDEVKRQYAGIRLWTLHYVNEWMTSQK